MEEHPQARQVINTLHRAGFVAYYAGGWVRDFLLQHPSDDIDIATNAPPETIQALFEHTVPIGIAFGIVLVIIDGHQYEVATFRQDMDYQDGRRPNRVEFSTAEEDAKRRDFTINGMFYDPIREEVLDYVDGKTDLKAGLIRAIGNPHERIREDRLRMIRAIRLACRFQFRIDPATELAIRAHANELFPAVAIERIVQELEKGHSFGSLEKMLFLLHTHDLLAPIFPELKGVSAPDLEKRLSPLKHYPEKAPLIAFLLPLFPDFSLEKQLELCKKLKLPNLDQQFTIFLHQAALITNRETEKVQWAHFYANPFHEEALEILAAHLEKSQREPFFKEHKKRIHLLQEAIFRIERHDPVVKSVALLEAGILPGKSMGLLLKEAERISCNEQIYECAPIIELLKKSPLWK